MNILAVLPAYRPIEYSGKVGGGEISNRILLEGLASKGHNVTACTLVAGSALDRHRNGVEVLWPSIIHSKMRMGKILGIANYKKLVENTVFSQKPDVILTGTYGIGSALFVSKKYNLPLGVFIRAFENFETFENVDGLLKFLVRRMVYGDFGLSALNKANFLLPNSVFMSNVCHKHVPSVPNKVIYPALSIDSVSPVKRNEKINEIYMVGSTTHKGFNVVEFLASKFPDLNFNILGSSGSNKYNIKFHGWVDVVDRLRTDADLLLVPSICQEAFGRVALEGLMSGTPTLVSNIGGLPETVNFEKDLLVEAGNNRAWCESLSRFIADSERVCLATERAQNCIDQFSINTQLEELENYIFSLLKNHANANA
jgi:glycosyltransferase involved in cell wall biosynthesis